MDRVKIAAMMERVKTRYRRKTKPFFLFAIKGWLKHNEYAAKKAYSS
jgi:hypothetical protein